MKRPWKILASSVALLALFGAWLFFRSADHAPQKAVEETRRALRAAGFKTDLAEFNFTTDAATRNRASLLSHADPNGKLSLPRDDYRLAERLQNQPELLEPIGSNTALVVWRQDKLLNHDEEPVYAAPPPASMPSRYFSDEIRGNDDANPDLWPLLRERLEKNRPALDAIGEAVLSGPIAFSLDASAGNGMLLRHLSPLKEITRTLCQRTVMELHDGHKEAAWTNLLAATRLVTTWKPEPVEISHLVRASGAVMAYQAAWQWLQAGDCPEERLAALQQEWAEADFFHDLPETAAFTRACAVDACQQERQQTVWSGSALWEMVRSPRYAWPNLKSYWNRQRYARQGSYEDEKALLLHYRDREVELRRAAPAANWLEMKALPGIAEPVHFQSSHSSLIKTVLNLKQMTISIQGEGSRFLARLAETEARRRLLLAAIALERARQQRGAYPQTLAELAPELLPAPPLDFMNGQPLHYMLADDGHFLLYSVGLDGVDNGGVMPRRKGRNPYEDHRASGVAAENDLLWPLPASPADVAAARLAEQKAQREQAERAEDHQAVAEWNLSAQRQAQAESILAAKPDHAPEPKHQGRPLREILRNASVSGQDNFTFYEMLTPKIIPTDEEPEIVTLELPISYDALTQIGRLSLFVDLDANDQDEMEMELQMGLRYEARSERVECRRAANGNVLLRWKTIYDRPGQHALRAALGWADGEEYHTWPGPALAYVSTHICQFTAASAYFQPHIGATLHGQLPETNGIYRVEIQTAAGEHVRTIEGRTTNGIIKIKWDLTDDHGRRFTNDFFNSIFHVTLPDSGRSQTQKGP